MNNELIPIERREGVTIYSRIVGTGGKLGQYEVHSEVLGYDGTIQVLYKDAEKRWQPLLGFKKIMQKVNSPSYC